MSIGAKPAAGREIWRIEAQTIDSPERLVAQEIDQSPQGDKNRRITQQEIRDYLEAHPDVDPKIARQLEQIINSPPNPLALDVLLTLARGPLSAVSDWLSRAINGEGGQNTGAKSIDLKVVNDPAALQGQEFDLRGGGKLSFRVNESYLQGLGDVVVVPSGSVVVERRELRAPDPLIAGGSTPVEYTFRLARSVPEGMRVEIRTSGSGTGQADWALQFDIT